MKHLNIVAAVIKKENKFLCLQRNYNKYDYISFKYEFPGGKIEVGESEQSALKREIFEELNIEIQIINKIVSINHDYPDFSITMHCYLCELLNNNEITLNDHVDYKWLAKEHLHSVDWAAADIPVLKHL